MKRFLLIPAVAGALVVAGAPLALAQAPVVPGPQTAACAIASVKVDAAAAAAADAAAKLDAANSVVLASLKNVVAAAQLDADAALAAYDKAVNAVPPVAADIMKANDAVKATQATLKAKLAALAAGPGVTSPTLTKLTADLQVLLDARATACGQQGPPPVVVTTTPAKPTTTVATPAPTTTAPPTTSAAPTTRPPFANCTAVHDAGLDTILSTDPLFQPGLDADGDGVGCEVNESTGTGGQVSVVPSDAPETGDGSTDALAEFLLS